MEEFTKLIIKWHHDRNLIEGASDKDQFCKLIQEAGELSDSICKGKDVKDDIGDMIVVLINIAERNNVSLEECLLNAWDDIKDRKGKRAKSHVLNGPKPDGPFKVRCNHTPILRRTGGRKLLTLRP